MKSIIGVLLLLSICVTYGQGNGNNNFPCPAIACFDPCTDIETGLPRCAEDEECVTKATTISPRCPGCNRFVRCKGNNGNGNNREECGTTTCSRNGEFCCNPSCSICAPDGGFCIQIACDGTEQVPLALDP